MLTLKYLEILNLFIYMKNDRKKEEEEEEIEEGDNLNQIQTFAKLAT